MKMLQVVGAMLMLLPFSELSKKIERYCVYYNDEAPIEAFSPYDLIVLDSTYHPKLEGLIEQKKTLLGYISLGEVEGERDYFEQVKAITPESWKEATPKKIRGWSKQRPNLLKQSENTIQRSRS